MSQVKTTYGIIGYPVEHSLSPLMHNAAFLALGLDAEYELFSIAPEELRNFFLELKEEQSPIFGLNVTVPYKQSVIEFLDNLSPFAKKAQAVNTIVIAPDRKLTGHNTDGPGFLAHMIEIGFNVENKRVAIMGAGGTTRAILAALCVLPERPDMIRLYNRTTSRAEALVSDLSKQFDTGIVEIVGTPDDLNIELCDLLINTTSVGMNRSDPLLINPDMLHSHMLVYDVIYSPQRTKLLEAAEEKGAQTANGLGMLFYQGVLAFQHWADIQLSEDIKAQMRESLISGARS